MNDLINKYADEIKLLCKQNQVKELYFFGSILDRKRFTTKSDIDILVDFKQGITLEEYTDSYFGLLFSLEDLLKRKIDITTTKSVRNPYFQQELEATKSLFYESVGVNG